jgi:transmembrane sensor
VDKALRKSKDCCESVTCGQQFNTQNTTKTKYLSGARRGCHPLPATKGKELFCGPGLGNKNSKLLHTLRAVLFTKHKKNNPNSLAPLSSGEGPGVRSVKSMNELEFHQLLDRYLKGEASEADTKRLDDFFASFQINTEDKQHFLQSKEDQLREEIYSRIQSRLHKASAEEHKSVQLPMPERAAAFPWYRAAAAVVLFSLLSYAAWFYVVPKEETIASLPVQNDFVSGGGKAVLKLADGTQVELDEKGSTAIPQQGVAQVISESGKLSYSSPAASAKEAPLYNTISTPRGGQYQLTLADGSKVWLNAASSLRFPAVFGGAERIVELTGEAYFEIAAVRQGSGKKMPFKVRIPSGAEVEVLGTHFNVMAYAEEESIKTTLLEGAVKISSAISSSPLERAGVRLFPNQQAQISKTGALSVIENYNVKEAVAWQDNKFVFKNTGLAEIMRQVSRWYDVEVIYQDDVSALRFGGTVSRKENASAVLNLLKLTGSIDFEVEGRKIIVKKANRNK